MKSFNEFYELIQEQREGWENIVIKFFNKYDKMFSKNKSNNLDIAKYFVTHFLPNNGFKIIEIQPGHGYRQEPNYYKNNDFTEDKIIEYIAEFMSNKNKYKYKFDSWFDAKERLIKSIRYYLFDLGLEIKTLTEIYRGNNPTRNYVLKPTFWQSLQR